MPSSVQIDVAQALVDELNDHSFSLDFEANRQSGELEYELVEANRLWVDVVPFSVKTTFADRGRLAYLVTTSICVRYKFNTIVHDRSGRVPNSVIDPYYVLTQEIHDYFHYQQPSWTGSRLTDVPEAAIVEGAEILAPYAKYLMEMQMFLGIIRLPYEVYRSPH